MMHMGDDFSQLPSTGWGDRIKPDKERLDEVVYSDERNQQGAKRKQAEAVN